MLKTDLQGRTAIVTGASRGIGRAFAERLGRAGCNVVLAAKTVEPHPKLAGTLGEAAAAVEAAGGRALAVQTDVRSEEQVAAMVTAAVQAFGGVDILINNAGAISLTPVAQTPVKRFDLMQQVNARAVFLCSQAALPHLARSDHAHILSLSPPLSHDRRWFAPHAPYTISKFGMTMLTLGMAEEFRAQGIAVNALWPRTIIATAAIEFAIGDAQMMRAARTPAIMADVLWEIVRTPPGELTGRCLIDEDFLRERGQTGFEHYRADPTYTGPLLLDLFE